ncbi:vegetative incompatibility het-e-1 [Trichoderma arundinaceum]|uniref:Vegetative incompatibility het-e-1 n=1 Tax=Trichoderma arundinaceum TaxID=490622 RepID=A0A395NTY3_TRIAR|nr:vegetative incompatibility het-e-1 [Trichoderma arundinaceum]
MIDREKLLRQVAKATSPKQKISGWCTISTGFANVVVHFACEQRILRTQLDVEKVTEDKIIKEDTRAKKLYGILELQNVSKAIGEGKNMVAKSGLGGEGNANKLPEEKISTEYIRATREEKAIVRILDYIQEPQLQLVAGEWVLARFSGVPDAKWFLCYLELGSTHQFYGHRVAATEIDFTNSAVEPGLMSAWRIYMDRKKKMMCKILDMYIQSSESAMLSEEKLSRATNLASDSYGKIADVGSQRFESVKSFSSISSLSMKLPFSISGGAAHDAKGKESDSDDAEDNFLDEIIDHTKEAAISLGYYTVLAAYEKFFEMRAQNLDKYLAVSVLKKTPNILQSVVENLDENKGFLPAMFHFGKRVHIF